MKPLMSLADYRLLLAHAGTAFEKDLLEKMRRRSVLTIDSQMPQNTVRLNTVVYLWHSLLRRMVRFRLVLPQFSDLSVRLVSVFAPIGQAVFGRGESESVRMPFGGGHKELRLIRVINQNNNNHETIHRGFGVPAA